MSSKILLSWTGAGGGFKTFFSHQFVEVRLQKDNEDFVVVRLLKEKTFWKMSEFRRECARLYTISGRAEPA